MCQFSGTELQAGQKSIKKQAEIILSGKFEGRAKKDKDKAL